MSKAVILIADIFIITTAFAIATDLVKYTITGQYEGKAVTLIEQIIEMVMKIPQMVIVMLFNMVIIAINAALSIILGIFKIKWEGVPLMVIPGTTNRA